MSKHSIDAIEETEEITQGRVFRRRRHVRVEGDAATETMPAIDWPDDDEPGSEVEVWEPGAHAVGVYSGPQLRNQRAEQVNRCLRYLFGAAEGDPWGDRYTVPQAVIILRAMPDAPVLEREHGRLW
jgi:hypothetical protein